MIMSSKSVALLAVALAGSMFVLAPSARADAPLKSALDLTIAQAAQVDEIQKQTREAIRPVRSELHREERALRRARLANDAEGIARQEALIAPLRAQFAAIHENEIKQIRAILTPEQNLKYTEYLKVRDEMAGSSRDVREYQGPQAELNK